MSAFAMLLNKLYFDQNYKFLDLDNGEVMQIADIIALLFSFNYK